MVFSRAIGYGRASLEHPSMDPRTPGYAHLGRQTIATIIVRCAVDLFAIELGLSVCMCSDMLRILKIVF